MTFCWKENGLAKVKPGLLFFLRGGASLFTHGSLKGLQKRGGERGSGPLRRGVEKESRCRTLLALEGRYFFLRPLHPESGPRTRPAVELRKKKGRLSQNFLVEDRGGLFVTVRIFALETWL